MKAIINQKLVRKSWSGRTVIPVTIIGTKENIINKVNEYILTRVNETNKIRVKCFHIELYNHHGKKIDNWEYKPTYR